MNEPTSASGNDDVLWAFAALMDIHHQGFRCCIRARRIDLDAHIHVGVNLGRYRVCSLREWISGASNTWRGGKPDTSIVRSLPPGCDGSWSRPRLPGRYTSAPELWIFRGGSTRT